MTLHTLSKSPLTTEDIFSACLRTMSPEDGLLLMQDAVYAALDTTFNQNLAKSLPQPSSMYVLREDLLARGLTGKLLRSIEVVDYPGFVELVCRYTKTVNWY